jgi:hypothetical protein
MHHREGRETSLACAYEGVGDDLNEYDEPIGRRTYR